MAQIEPEAERRQEIVRRVNGDLIQKPREWRQASN